MPRSRQLIRLVPTVLVASLLGVAGCSGGGSDDAATPTSSTVASKETSTTAVVAEPARGTEGCGTAPTVTAPDDGGDLEQTFDSGGTERSYRLAIPKGYDPDKPTPLILNLHGSGSNAVQQSVYTQVPARGAEAGYIVVTPDAIDGKWEMGPTGADDVFLTGLLDHIEDSYCVDVERVHAAGISLGSWKATITACSHQDRFASLALVAEEVAPPNCAVPVVAFHGTADHVVPYGEGADDGIVVGGFNGGLPGVEINMPDWARNAGCDDVPEIEKIGDDVERWVYPNCPAGRGVEFYSVKGGGHSWPGAEIDVPSLGPVTKTIDATEIALTWFEDHPLVR